VVASAEPGGLVGGLQERFDLWFGEVGEVVALVAFARDRHDPGDRGEVLGVAQSGVAVERVDCREAGVAGPGRVAAVLLEVGAVFLSS
jgi:hypothetical protein